MSDIDDLLDDNDKIEMKQPVRARNATMQFGSKKAFGRDEDLNEADLLEEALEEYDEERPQRFSIQTPKQGSKAQIGFDFSTTSKGSKTTKKKVDKTKITDKIDKALKKNTADKKKFTSSIDDVFNDPFFKSKPSTKARDNEEFNLSKPSKTNTTASQDTKEEGKPNQSLSEIPKAEKTPKRAIPKEDKLNVIPKEDKSNVVPKEDKFNNQSINELPKADKTPKNMAPKEDNTINKSLNEIPKNDPPKVVISKEGKSNNQSLNDVHKPEKSESRSDVESENTITTLPVPTETRENRAPSMSDFSKTPKADNSGRASLTVNIRAAEPEKAMGEQVSIKSESEQSRASELLRQNNDNERPEEGSSFSSNHMYNQSTNMNSFLEKETIETPTLPDELQSAGYDENSEDKLDLELLSSKVSVLKNRTMADVAIPGNQRIIRRIRSIPQGSPDKKESSLQGLDTSMLAKKTLSHSMTVNPEDALERFEREDYEAARILSVDESIKNFLVSENPSANEYTVPLTKLVGLSDMSRPFYFAFEGQPTEFGRPTTIKRIGNSIILIGTSNGLIVGFDAINYQKLFKLGDSKEASYGSVTAVDFRIDGKHLVAGYEKGNLVVFDILKKIVVKMTSTVHEAAIISLTLVRNEPLQYLSVDTAGIVVLNELERMMLLYNQNHTYIFSKSANMNFVQLEILNHKYPLFTKTNTFGDEELVIAYAATQQISITTLEPISKTIRVLLNYRRPPMVPEGAIPHICWYEHQAATKLMDLLKDENKDKSPSDLGLSREAVEGRYSLYMAWGFCVFWIQMTTFDTEIEFKEMGYVKFESLLIHLQLIGPNTLVVIDDNNFIHVIHTGDLRNHPEFYLPDGNRGPRTGDEVKVYSIPLKISEGGQVFYQRSFYFKDPDGGMAKIYHNTINTDFKLKETLIIQNNCIYSLKVKDWSEILDEIEAQKNWLKLFTIGLALYHNTIKEVEQHSDEVERKNALREHFKDGLRRFITSQLMGKELTNEGVSWNHLAEEVTLTLIDFCLETEMEDFLFTDAKLCSETLKFKEVYLRSLEPFIRWNKVNIFPSFDPLREVINFYADNGKISVTQKLIASLDLNKFEEGERDDFLLSLVTICLEKNLFTALLYVCIKGTGNFTLPFFTFWKLAVEADRQGNIRDKKKYILRCLWYIKTIFKRKVAFEEEQISEEKTKIILKDLIILLMEERNLAVFYEVEANLTTVLIGMLFTGEISLFLEDLYGEIQLERKKSSANDVNVNNLHYQMLNKINTFYEGYFAGNRDKEKRPYLGFITAKIVENQTHKFLNEKICIDLARYLIKYPDDIDELVKLDYRLNRRPTIANQANPAEGLGQISDDDLTETKGSMIERLLMYARMILRDQDTLNDLIKLSATNKFAEPVCYLLSLKKEYYQCLDKYLSPSNPQKTKKKAIDWVLTTMKQLTANRDDTIDDFKRAVLDKIKDLVSVDPEKATYLIHHNFKGDIKTMITRLSGRPDLQIVFVEMSLNDSSSQSFVDSEIMEQYTILLAQSPEKAHREKVLQVLKKQDKHPPKYLDVCRKYDLKEAQAFLEEVRGSHLGIKEAIRLRYEILKEHLLECIKTNESRMTQEQKEKFTEKFSLIGGTIKNHFPDNGEIWFDELQRIVGIENIINENIRSTKGKNLYRSLFEDLLEKKYLDEIIECLPIDEILFKVSERSTTIPPLLLQKFLARILKDNHFEQKFAESAHEMQKYDIMTFLNINLIPNEIKGVSLYNMCAYCDKPIGVEHCVVFNCGHIYHSSHGTSKRGEIACELCANSSTALTQKVFNTRVKKHIHPSQHRHEDASSRDGSDGNQPVLKTSAINTRVMKDVRYETRLNAIYSAAERHKDEVVDLVYNYHVL